jgi:uncharacterized membrane protein
MMELINHIVALLSNPVAMLGVFASLLILTSYILLESGKFTTNSPPFYTLNIIGSICLIITISNQFDSADSGAIFMECAWLLISLKGLLRTLKKKP